MTSKKRCSLASEHVNVLPRMEELRETESTKPAVSAFDRILYFIGRRNHSEKEMRQKLDRRFEKDEVERAIAKAKEVGLLPDDETSAKNLSLQFAQALHRKNKGLSFIQGYLRQKGLPPVDREPDLELEKARNLLRRLGRKTREQATRFYIARGFERDVVAQILKEKKWVTNEK